MIRSLLLCLIFLLASCVNVQKKAEQEKKEQDEMMEAYKLEQAMQKKEVKNCTSTREYIATSEYLKSQSSYFENQQELDKVAREVSRGCTGAARRFVQVFKTMMKVDAGTRIAVKEGVLLAQNSDEVTEAYLNIFMTSYLDKYLDLDIHNSVQVARQLSVQYEGAPQVALEDYQNFVQFCLSSKSLDLSRPQCAKFARDWAALGTGFPEGSYTNFVKLFHFLTQKEKGPGLTTYAALKKTEQVMSVSPFAVENYILAFEYAIEKKGLNLETVRALSFAENMAQNTRSVASEPMDPESKSSEENKNPTQLKKTKK